MSGFNEPFDQDVIDKRDSASSVVKRKQRRSSEDLRNAQNKFEDQLIMTELGLTREEYYDE